MSVLPIVFVFIAFWNSTIHEVTFVPQDQLRNCWLNPKEIEYSWESNGSEYQIFFIEDENSMNYLNYCIKKNNEENQMLG